MAYPEKPLATIFKERKDRVNNRMRPLQDELKRINAAEAAYKNGNAERAKTLLNGAKTTRKRAKRRTRNSAGVLE